MGKSYAAIHPLTLYSRNAPFFHEKWALVGTVEGKYLFAFSNHTMILMCLAILLILAFGMISSLFISRYLSAPIARLSGEVAVAQKNPTAMPEFSYYKHTGTGSLCHSCDSAEPGCDQYVNEISADHGDGQCGSWGI